jgi:hypothetical protein
MPRPRACCMQSGTPPTACAYAAAAAACCTHQTHRRARSVLAACVSDGSHATRQAQRPTPAAPSPACASSTAPCVVACRHVCAPVTARGDARVVDARSRVSRALGPSQVPQHARSSVGSSASGSPHRRWRGVNVSSSRRARSADRHTGALHRRLATGAPPARGGSLQRRRQQVGHGIRHRRCAGQWTQGRPGVAATVVRHTTADSANTCCWRPCAC